jgi:hypothetical protein
MNDQENAGTIESPPPAVPPRQPSATIIAALVAAQSRFGRVEKNRENPAFRSSYATLSACLDAVLPALNDNGFFLTQFLSNTPDALTVETIVHHDSGESMVLGVFTLSPTKFDPQGVGSASTYAKRYGLKAAFGLSDAEDDDDGNGACAHVPRNQPPQNARSAPAQSKASTTAPKAAPPQQAGTAAKPAERQTAPPASDKPAAPKLSATQALAIIATHEQADMAKLAFKDVEQYGNAMGYLMGAGADAVKTYIEAKTGKPFSAAPAPHVRALVTRWRKVYVQFCKLKGLAKHHCGAGHDAEAKALLDALKHREGWVWGEVAPEAVEKRASEIEASGVWQTLEPAPADELPQDAAAQ